MWINRNQLVPNNVLLEDVLANSGNIIIPRNTILTEKHIKIIHYFLIEQVKVSKELSHGRQFIPKEGAGPLKRQVKEEDKRRDSSFYEYYETAVREYKKMFLSWQSGLNINLTKIREVFLPLLDKLEEVEGELYILSNYSRKEDYLFYHAVSVGLLSSLIAKRLDYDRGEQIQLALAGLLSDSGMSKLNPTIFSANRSLYMREQEDIFYHPTYSYQLVESIPTLSQAAKLAILQHHERNDESGYPFKLGRDKIHSYAHIIAVSDIYHAMTSERMYQKASPPFIALENIIKKKGIKLNEQVIDAFIKSILPMEINSKVLLSNGKKGTVLYINHDNPLRPIISLEKDKLLPLESHPNIHIEEIVQ